MFSPMAKTGWPKITTQDLREPAVRLPPAIRQPRDYSPSSQHLLRPPGEDPASGKSPIDNVRLSRHEPRLVRGQPRGQRCNLFRLAEALSGGCPSARRTRPWGSGWLSQYSISANPRVPRRVANTLRTAVALRVSRCLMSPRGTVRPLKPW